MLLGDILVRRGKLTREQLAEASPRGADPSDAATLAEELLRLGLVSAADTAAAMGEAYGCEAVGEVDDEMLDPSLVASLPVEWARSRGMLPIQWNGRPAVLCADPSKVQDLDYVSLLLKRDLGFVVAPRKEVERAIEQCYFRRSEKPQDQIGRAHV